MIDFDALSFTLTDVSVSVKDRVMLNADVPVRDRLLQAATDVFCARGYSSARVSDIVERAGVAQGTFYLYFKSKSAVFLTLIDELFDELLTETVGRHPAASLRGTDDMVRQIRNIWRTIFEICRARPDLTKLVLHHVHALGPEQREHVEKHYRRAADVLATYMREAIDLGLAKSVTVDLAAWALVGMVERSIHFAVNVEPEADLDVLADDLVRIELTGLLSDPFVRAADGRW